MNKDNADTFKQTIANLMAWLSKSFDTTAAWVTKLSWWKFFLFAIITITAGGLLQDILFTSEENVVVTKSSSPKKTKKTSKITDGDTSIEIDDTGLHIRKNNLDGKGKQIEIDENGIHIRKDDGIAPPAPPAPPAAPSASDPVAPPVPPEPPRAPSITDRDDIHIKLPAELAKEISEEINNAVADAADEEVRSYKRTSSKWFANFVVLLVVGLFGMKALMSGKIRAEEKAKEAGMAAERESLLRQVSEAQMQMMQAQVEPHFLFNTLAGVRSAILTEPERATAIVDHLVDYLRATIPQMRNDGSSGQARLKQQLEAASAYLGLMHARIPRLSYSVDSEVVDAALPPLMLISLVENAVKHGVEPKIGPVHVAVFAKQLQQDGLAMLELTVADNGVGFAGSSSGSGIGLANIHERLASMYGKRASLVLKALPEGGVAATILLPLEP